MSTTGEAANEIRPFHIEVPEEALEDLRRRIAATRWPSRELVADRSQGVQSATIQALARYWASEYDWRTAEARLNALPQFTTTIDGVEIHFLHVKSPHEQALPLIATHGWPGSVIELLDTIGPDRPDRARRHPRGRLPPGAAVAAWLRLLGRADRARLGVRPHRTRVGGADGPPRLQPLCRPGRGCGCPRHGLDGPPGGRGVGRLPPEPAHGGARNRRSTAQGIRTGTRSGRGDRDVPAGRLRLLPGDGNEATDDRLRPAGFTPSLAAWLLDHDTDSYYKISRAFVDGEPVGNLTRDNIVDNITLYWLTGTAASAARSYWEDGRALAAARQRPASSGSQGAGRLHHLPREIWASPRSWVEAVYPDLAYFNEADKGGHFAAWEEPQLFSEKSGPRSGHCASRSGGGCRPTCRRKPPGLYQGCRQRRQLLRNNRWTRMQVDGRRS